MLRPHDEIVPNNSFGNVPFLHPRSRIPSSLAKRFDSRSATAQHRVQIVASLFHETSVIHGALSQEHCGGDALLYSASLCPGHEHSPRLSKPSKTHSHLRMLPLHNRFIGTLGQNDVNHCKDLGLSQTWRSSHGVIFRASSPGYFGDDSAYRRSPRP